jgi:hypothetical protein
VAGLRATRRLPARLTPGNVSQNSANVLQLLWSTRVMFREQRDVEQLRGQLIRGWGDSLDLLKKFLNERRDSVGPLL